MAKEVRDKSCPIAFNHESRSHAERWPEAYREIRERCPIAWTGELGGFWVATRHDDIVAMAQAGATFSSSKTFDPATGAVTGGVAIPPVPITRGLPLESDKPEWTVYRGYLNKHFGPKAAEARRQRVRLFAHALLDRVIETGHMDLVNDFTGPVTAITTMELMGLPLQEWREFADPLHAMVYTPTQSPNYPRVIEGVSWIFQRCHEEFIKQRRQPQCDGLLSYFGHETIDGRMLSDEEVMSFCINILVGGTDTTTALATNTFVYLHDNPEQKRRLMEDPGSIPVAREEFLRFFTPFQGAARNVTSDVGVGDVEMRQGDRVWLAFSAANRDPVVFAEPEKIDMARFPNPHVAFGSGSHRCIGSFLARVMFEEMLAAILDRIPDYRVDLDRAQKYPSVGVINGWINMPTSFPPGHKKGGDLIL